MAFRHKWIDLKAVSVHPSEKVWGEGRSLNSHKSKNNYYDENCKPQHDLVNVIVDSSDITETANISKREA